MTQQRTTIYVSQYTPALLRMLAEQLGFTADRGAATGNGSISKLMDEVAGLVATYGVDVMVYVLRPMLKARHEHIKAMKERTA